MLLLRAAALGALLPAAAAAGSAAAPSVLRAPLGRTPVLDGRIDAREWSDAFEVSSLAGWDAQFAPVEPPPAAQPPDLYVRLWLKHDARSLWLAARVVDDVLYAGAWLPHGNAAANALNASGWPWFGDESEVLFSALPPAAAPAASVVGNGSQWQLVVNRWKSARGGLGVGGLLQGEPRSSPAAWETYSRWIAARAVDAAVTSEPGAGPNGASVWSWEWRIDFDPCLELAPGVFYHAGMPTTAVGINVALGDTDLEAQGDATYGLRHEMWVAGHTCPQTNCHTLMSEFATLLLEPGGL